MKIVLASNNSGKIREFKELLKNFPIELIPQEELGVEEVEETATTFVENALIKARHAAKITGFPAIADDSGLVVPALSGAPGIYSARYAGKQATPRDNINKLLFDLTGVPDAKRTANFYCVIIFIAYDLDPTPFICEGSWEGRILTAAKGEKGFGYDPVFYVPSEKKSAAEIPLARKNIISHRGVASHILLKKLTEKI